MCSCEPINFDVMIVRDMADKHIVQRLYPEHNQSDFIFLKDVEQKLNGWIPTNIRFSYLCSQSPDFPGVEPLLHTRKAQGSRVTCLGS